MDCFGRYDGGDPFVLIFCFDFLLYSFVRVLHMPISNKNYRKVANRDSGERVEIEVG